MGERVALGGVGRDGGRLVELRWRLPKQGMLRSRGPEVRGRGRGPGPILVGVWASGWEWKRQAGPGIWI